MSTMDIIKLYGGEPANFLDVGGSAEGQALIEAMKLLNSDKEVKAIFINIFGGILRCDKLAGSIIEANKMHKFSKPIVLRLKGTMADVAKEMIAGREKELGIFYNEDFDSAAQQVCKIVTGKKWTRQNEKSFEHWSKWKEFVFKEWTAKEIQSERSKGKTLKFNTVFLGSQPMFSVI